MKLKMMRQSKFSQSQKGAVACFSHLWILDIIDTYQYICTDDMKGEMKLSEEQQEC